MDTDPSAKSIGIGTRLWKFDASLGYYSNNKVNRSKQYREYSVISETSRSWIVGYFTDEMRPVEVGKISKKPSESDLRYPTFMTDEQKDDHVFRILHQFNIAGMVQSYSMSAATLRKVAEVIGYVAKDEPE